MTECDFLTLPSGRQMHYRKLGEGPPLIILHPSPQSSEAMAPAMNAFSKVCQCIAIDTPGYGLSDDMVQSEPTLGDYADVVIEAADALGLASFFLYGAATGAQIAIEIGKNYPERVKFLMLESNGHILDDNMERMLDGYFPDVSPRRDGGHLLTYWDMCTNLYFAFPWHSTRPQDRFGIQPPPIEVTQQTLLRYLQAGDQYASAYRMAFYAEKRSHMNGLNVPAVMTRWEGGLIVSIADELIAKGLPDCMRVLYAGPSLEERFAVQVEALREAIEANPVAPAQFNLNLHHTRGPFRKKYLQTSNGPVFARLNDDGEGKPIAVLHGAGGSSQQMIPLISRLIGKRPILLLDLPGHGASLSMTEPDAFSVDKIARVCAEALAATGHSEFDFITYGLGSAIASALPRTIKTGQIFALDPAIFPQPPMAMISDQNVLNLRPQPDGTHLIKLWSIVRNAAADFTARQADTERSATGRDEMAADIMHQRVCDILRCGTAYAQFLSLERRSNQTDGSHIINGLPEEITDWATLN